MPTRKSQSAKEKSSPKRENLIVKFVRRAIFFALVVTCGALYWQNTNLSSQDRLLTERLTVASKRLAKYHQTIPPVDDTPVTIVEAAQLHITRAKDALNRNDYATALAETERAGTDIGKATQDASAETRNATKTLTTNIAELRQKIADLTGHAATPPYEAPKPTHKASKDVT